MHQTRDLGTCPPVFLERQLLFETVRKMTILDQFYTVLATSDNLEWALLFKKTGNFKILAKSLHHTYRLHWYHYICLQWALRTISVSIRASKYIFYRKNLPPHILLAATWRELSYLQILLFLGWVDIFSPSTLPLLSVPEAPSNKPRARFKLYTPSTEDTYNRRCPGSLGGAI